jgi:hypothetical protein
MPKTKRFKLDDYPRDAKRGHRAKSQTLARKRARQTKRAIQGR